MSLVSLLVGARLWWSEGVRFNAAALRWVGGSSEHKARVVKGKDTQIELPANLMVGD